MEHVTNFDAEPWVVINPLSPNPQHPTAPSNRSAAAQEAASTGGKKKNTKNVPCRFWGTATGCRAGDHCRFYHDPALVESAQGELEAEAKAGSTPSVRQYLSSSVAASMIVPKPVSNQQVADPRTFEIKQVRRRYSPKEMSFEYGTDLAIKMPPSDPDFPFELDYLDCVLHVPIGYPASGNPSLRVNNEAMERVHQAAVERGFDSIVAQAPKATLLSYLNTLDKQLERLLSGDKEEIKFKLVANRGKPEPSPASAAETVEAAQASDVTLYPFRPFFSDDELREAAMTRATEARQLEARLGRLPLYNRVDEYTFTLPLEPRRRDELPLPLQSVKSLHLHVPEVYPLEPCTVTIPGVLDEAAILAEVAFEQRAAKHRDQTLLTHVNYLAQNLHVLATQIEEPEPVEAEEKPAKNEVADTEKSKNEKRSHIRYIPRPPEWEEDFDDESSDEDSGPASEEDGSEEEDENQEDVPTSTDATEPGPDRGVALDLVGLELVGPGTNRPGGVAVAEITELCLSVQCMRCKTVQDVKLKPQHPESTRGRDASRAVTSSLTCPRCTSALSVTFRPSAMTNEQSRAGYLDLNGCRPAELLPDTEFILTCQTCTLPFPPASEKKDLTEVVGRRLIYNSAGYFRDMGNQGRAYYRYDPVCKDNLWIKWAHTHFLLQSTKSREVLPPRRKLKASELELLYGKGWKGGTALPKNGVCEHYARSYRWFRFGCCAKAYPCDRCHDEAENHVCERASRMVCGFCAREQAFHPSECVRCGALLVKKRGGTGFWEGGKGTRERVRMSRKDPRKYKRRGQSLAGSKGKGKEKGKK